MKSKIIEAVIEVLEKNVQTYENNLNTLETNTNLDENATVDIDERSQQGEATDLSARMQEPLIAIENTISSLKQFKDASKNDAGNGAIVETDTHFFIMGAAVPPMDVDGKKVAGITLDAPAYAELEGKKKGDSFNLGDTEYRILNVW